MNRDQMIAEIERESGGRVITVPPIVTGKGWRATIHGGDVGLLSVTMGVDTSEEDALRELAARLAETEERHRIGSR